MNEYQTAALIQNWTIQLLHQTFNVLSVYCMQGTKGHSLSSIPVSC